MRNKKKYILVYSKNQEMKADLYIDSQKLEQLVEFVYLEGGLGNKI